MSRNQKKRPHKTAPSETIIHVVPLEASRGFEAGVAVCATCHGEDGEVLDGFTASCAEHFDATFQAMHKAARRKIAHGAWWLRVDADLSDAEAYDEAIAETADQLHEVVLEHIGDVTDVTYCDDCSIGEPCAVWGPRANLAFVPRSPPPPEVDTDAVRAIADVLVEADAKGLAIETMQAAFARFCALRPRKAAHAPLTMTPIEAAALLKLPSWPCSRETVETHFRTASHASHPDLGGSAEAMQRVAEAKRALIAAIEADARASNVEA